jgi:hypothetical protein
MGDSVHAIVMRGARLYSGSTSGVTALRHRDEVPPWMDLARISRRSEIPRRYRFSGRRD